MQNSVPAVSPQVLCVGEILWDYLADRPGAIEQVTAWIPYPGGAPANVACALTQLGTSAGFIGCIGEDDPGERLVMLLQQKGVDCAGVQRHATAPTRIVYVLRSPTGDRQFVGFGGKETTDFADTRLLADLLPAESFAAAQFLVTGTLGLASPDTAAAIDRAVTLAHEQNVAVLVDVNWRPVFWPQPNRAAAAILPLLQRAHFVKCSDEEAAWLFETTDPAIIADRLAVQGVLVTAGDRGCAYCFGKTIGDVPAFPVEVEDTTGAGDSFVAGFVHQLVKGRLTDLNDPATARQIVQYASAVGALTTTRSGAISAQPSAAEVEAFLYLNRRARSE